MIIKQNSWYALRLYPYYFQHFVDIVGQKSGPDNAATNADYNTRGAPDM
jgi:phosphorylcholine metabolism protein LicD